jgi:hypothetical protein
MPDHLHLFVAIDGERLTLSAWMKSLKGTLSSKLRAQRNAPPYWQKGFLITCFVAATPIHKNGPMYGKIPCEQVWQQVGRVAIPWRDICSRISRPSLLIINATVGDRRYINRFPLLTFWLRIEF